MSLPTDCIKMLIAILERFKLDDSKYAKEGAELHYSCNIEIDSNVTIFEMLSNSNLILVKSHLPENQQTVLISILYSLYDDNYWRFDSDDIDSITYQDEELNNDKIDKMRKYDIDEWYNYLCQNKNEISCQNECTYELIKPDILPEYYSHRMYEDYYKKLYPDVSIYRIKSPKQKIYTIDDIINLAQEKIE